MNLSAADVAAIVRLLDDSAYQELELETPEFRLVLRRGDGGGWSQQQETRTEPKPIAAARGPEPGRMETAASAAVGPAAESGLEEVLSPIVGTFYRAPNPGAAPYVELGSKVEPDTVVAIIEVMKLMNSVAAGVAGEVVEICVDNAELVEQGQPLLRVRPRQ